MDNDKDKDKPDALVKYEPKSLTFAERLDKKKRELREALERGEVSDPITAAIGAITLTQALLAGASVAISILTPLIAGALTPRQKFLEERGRRTGDLVINSELGVLIPEVYFGAGDDGYGGSWVPAMVGWSSGIRKHVSTTTSTAGGGGGKFGGRGATTEVREITYDLDWLLIWANKGPYRLLRSKANADVIYDLYGAVSSYEGEAASSYTAPTVIAAFEHASGGSEVTLQNHASGNGGIVEWTAVQSNGAATRQLSIYYRTSSGGSFPIELTINGGTPLAIALPATNEVYLSHTVSVVLNDGVNTVKIQNKSTTLHVGIDKIYCFPGHSAATTGTGILDPTVGADAPYDPLIPPNPATSYTTPVLRWDGTPDVEPTGGQTGVMNHGGNAQFAIYPGNTTQLTDPTYEAAIDAQHGAGSTPAYRGRCYEVDHGFYLTRWGGMVPNRVALLEHETIKTKAQFDAFMCSRVGMDLADHDFSALETVRPRGLRIAGTRFEARDAMQAAEIPFDVVYAEQEGVLVGKLKYPFTSVVTLTDKDFGWNDDEETSDGPLTLIDVVEPDETDLPRRVDVKYVDLDRDGEPGLQGYGRQVTVGEDSVTLDLDWTFTKDEAQALAQKEVYRRHTEKPCRYVLSWEHLWINVGDVFTATLTDGFTYTILHVKDSGGLGVRQCEGILLDEPLFTQSAVVDPYGYEQPIVPLPAMTIMSLLDTPLLRDGDITNNDGVGWYWVATRRTGTNQTWQGASLVMFKNGEWQPKAESSLPGTIGTVISVSDLYSDPDVVDIVFTADASTNIFTSVANLLVDGDEITVVNTGGALPASLVAGTSYFVRDKSGDTFKLAATSGGAAIDITTDGTGTNAINVGKIVVDLYGTTQTLSSVTTADILGGANLALAGSMLFNFATAIQVAGFPNRWTLTTLLTGQRDTDDYTVNVAIGDRFVLIDGAVKFVPMELTDINTEYDYKAVTVGQSLDDAATIPAVWTGNARRTRKVINLIGLRVSNDLISTWDPGGDVLEIEKYVLRVRNAATDALVRTHIVKIEDPVPCKWTYLSGAGDQGNVTMSPDGSISVSEPEALSYKSQAFVGDMTVEWEVDSRYMCLIGLVPALFPTVPAWGVYVEIDHFVVGSDLAFIVAEGSTGLKRRLHPNSRVRIDVRNGQAEYYINNSFWMRSNRPVLDVPASVNVVASFNDPLASPPVTEPQAMLRVRVTPYVPRQFVYTEEMQTVDFPSGVPATVIVEVTQVSHVGLESAPVRIEA
ncbi:MAG: phage tail protein [Acidobacteriota bacterium]